MELIDLTYSNNIITSRRTHKYHYKQWILETLFGIGEFLPSNAFMDALADLLCDEDSVPELCGSVLFLLCGFDSAQLNMTLLDTIVHHTPAGASSKTLVHYAQEMSSRKHIRV